MAKSKKNDGLETNEFPKNFNFADLKAVITEMEDSQTEIHPATSHSVIVSAMSILCPDVTLRPAGSFVYSQLGKLKVSVDEDQAPSPAPSPSPVGVLGGCLSGLQVLFSSLETLGGAGVRVSDARHGGGRHRNGHRAGVWYRNSPELWQAARCDDIQSASADDNNTLSGAAAGGDGTTRLLWRLSDQEDRSSGGCECCTECFCGSCLGVLTMRPRPRRHGSYRSTQ
ncbi:hypothetical protein BaRGS_00019726, partial [Batillaria attramentaria]